MRHKAEFLRDPTIYFFPPYLPFFSPLLTPCRRKVWKNVLFVHNFSFYSLYRAIVSLGRLYFSIPLTLKFAIWLAWAKGKWAQVIINEFCAEILKGIANFCQVLLVFLSSAMRSAYPRKLLTAKWDTYEQISIWFTALSRAAISDPQTHEEEHQWYLSKPLRFRGGVFAMQQHHSLSWITHKDKCHLLGTHTLPSTANISSFNLQNFLLRSANASIFHETFAQRRQGLTANKWLSQKLKFMCAQVQILRWPKSSFGFLVTFHGKSKMNFLANPIQWLFHGFFLFFLQLKPQVIATTTT